MTHTKMLTAFENMVKTRIAQLLKVKQPAPVQSAQQLSLHVSFPVPGSIQQERATAIFANAHNKTEES